MQPEVTAIITTHARPAFVRSALASVQAETQPNLEVIVVDDGGAFVAPAGSRVAVRTVYGSMLGVARARNLGLSAARGEFVIYLDDDDVALPNRISCLLSTARREQADLCFGMTRRIVDSTAASLPDVPTHLISSGAVGFCDLLTCAPHVDAVLVRTETLRAVGGFDVVADHFDDWAAWLRISDRGAAIRCMAEPVAEWRVHSQGLSAKLVHGRAMKQRLLALFRHLEDALSPANAQALTAARQLVAVTDITTYDDYVCAMASARDVLHAGGTCFGRPLHWHSTPVAEGVAP
jgi:hypothetical protein